MAFRCQTNAGTSDEIPNPFDMLALKINGAYDICLDVNGSGELIVRFETASCVVAQKYC